MAERAAEPTRRRFLQSAAAAAAGTLARPSWSWAAPFGLQLGYAAITWQGQDEQAIDDIAAVGFKGIQLRSATVERYGAKPEELRARLKDKGLSLLCFSSGSVDADPAKETVYLELHLKHARFVKALDGRFLQILSTRPRDRAPTPEEFERLGKLLSELGRRVADTGLRLVYHNHLGAFGEAPDEVARVLEATDPKAMGFLLDIAHYQQGGGDPVAAVARHRDRLEILHLKDVVSPVPGDAKPPRQSYQWVELGRGKVDVPAVIGALKKASFNGPAIIELDRSPDPARTPKDCALINKKYVTETLGLTL
jgi:inosose dehydratase